jgi:hypothetical protein
MTEPQAPLCAVETGHVAVPPNHCLNGCHTGHGADRTPRETEGAALICKRCIKQLDGWLRTIPETYALLPRFIQHGSVETNPESAHVKLPDPPAPMRLEIVDLLDTRRGTQFDDDGLPMAGVDNRRGVFGTMVAWAGRIHLERNLPRPCDCGHDVLLHRWAVPMVSLCRANCACANWVVTATLAGECAFITGHLAWVTEQDWVEDLYTELKPLVRELGDAVGDYRPAAIGMCLAEVPAPGLTAVNVLCGGPLYRDEEGHGVHCARCGDKTGIDTLQRLGRVIGILSDTDHQEAS